MKPFKYARLLALVATHVWLAACLGQSVDQTEDQNAQPAAAGLQSAPWPESVTKIVNDSPNKKQLQKLLAEEDGEIRAAVEFLINNMPKQDLEALGAEFLLEDIQWAIKIRKQSKWKMSDQIFFNYVLPYANVDETREPWREKLNKICLPLIADCKTSAEAAQELNSKFFKKIGVKYSTKRKKANQSPSESMEQGLASCTGLSILLVDACRSVGVPARLTGIPSWTNKRGNHTWVEIWDGGTEDQKGEWHFTGAAEPSKKGLNNAWFQKDAALAKKDSRRNAIYAISFAKTDTTFPMVWTRGWRNSIHAINVTDRYTKSKKQEEELNVDLINAYVRVWNKDKTERVVTFVSIEDKDGWRKGGRSRGNQADMNDMLQFQIKKNSEYRIKLGDGQWQTLTTTDKKQQTFEFQLEK